MSQITQRTPEEIDGAINDTVVTWSCVVVAAFVLGLLFGGSLERFDREQTQICFRVQ